MTDVAEKTQLLPCPFCGGTPTLVTIEPHSHRDGIAAFMPDHYGSAYIECGCGAGLIDEDEKTVAGRWNGRPTGVAQGAVNRRLAEFFKWAMREGPWEGGDLDGGSVQDKAESLGLIVKTKYDPAVHGPAADWMFEAGDDYYTFAPDLAAQPPAAPVDPKVLQMASDLIAAGYTDVDKLRSDMESMVKTIFAEPAAPVETDEWEEVTDGTTKPGDRFSYIPNPETGVGQITSHKRRVSRSSAETGDHRNQAERLLNAAMDHIAGTLEQPSDLRAWDHLLIYAPTGAVFNRLVKALHYDGPDTASITLSEIARAVEGAKLP